MKKIPKWKLVRITREKTSKEKNRKAINYFKAKDVIVHELKKYKINCKTTNGIQNKDTNTKEIIEIQNENLPKEHLECKRPIEFQKESRRHLKNNKYINERGELPN